MPSDILRSDSNILSEFAVNPELAYAEITSNFVRSGASSNVYTDITGLSITLTVRNRPIELVFFAPWITNNTASGSCLVALFEGTTQLVYGVVLSSTASGGNALTVRVRLTPSAGAHTYKAQIRTSGANQTGTILAGPVGTATTGGPSFIQAIEL